jgi:hypothetical protein|tara:strand:+ start:2061 stop:4538 length:2478 start_codon:yes stop_codon:yes gene_type:complete
MAENNDLYKAYSILGAGTTAEYNRRRKEEEKYRKRARRDQLLGYVIAPLGQELAKGVSNLISAPFEKPVEKLLQTEQGRSLKKDLKSVKKQQERYGLLGKKIDADFQGDSYEYHFDKLTKEADESSRQFFMDQGYTDQDLKDSEHAVMYNLYRASLNDSIKERATEENNQYVSGRDAVATFKKGQDVTDILAKSTPYASGPVGGFFRGLKRTLTGTSPLEAFKGPTQQEKERAIMVARQGLGLDDDETSELLEASKAGLSVSKLENKIERLAQSKNPVLQNWWAGQQDHKDFVIAVNQGAETRSVIRGYNNLKAKDPKSRAPTRQQVIQHLGNELDLFGLKINDSQRKTLEESLATNPLIQATKDKFKDNVAEQFNAPDGYNKASSAIQTKVDAKWAALTGSAVTSAQLNFARHYDSMSVKDQESYIKNTNPADQLGIIMQGATSALNSLDFTGGKKEANMFGWKSVTDVKYTGALANSGFDYTSVWQQDVSPESRRRVQQLSRDVSSGRPSSRDVNMLVPLEQVDVDQIESLSGSQQEERIAAYERSGFNVSNYTTPQTESGSDDGNDSGTSGGGTVLTALKENRDIGVGPLNYAGDAVANIPGVRQAGNFLAASVNKEKGYFAAPRQEIGSWIEALDRTLASDSFKYRNMVTGDDSRTGRPFGAEVTATSALEPIPLEETSSLLEAPATPSDRQQGLLYDIERNKGFSDSREPTSSIADQSSLSIEAQEIVNSFDVPSVTTKEGRGVVSKMKTEVKEQLGADLSRSQVREVMSGLVDPTDEQIQKVLTILQDNAPKKLIDPEEDQIKTLLGILGQSVPLKMED